MKRHIFDKFICKKSRLIAGALSLLFVLTLTGCDISSKGGLKSTTEAATEEVHIEGTDEDGFYPASGYVQTTRDEVYVYVDTDTSSEKYLTLKAGVELERTGTKENWTRVLVNGASYYVPSTMVTDTDVKWATENDVQRVSHVIFIDPAKQITEDSGLESVTPIKTGETESGQVLYSTVTDASRSKARMSAAAVGTSTGTFEYDITLAVAEEMQSELQHRGYTVVLSRTTSNVNLSNAERAQMANEAHADIYIRLEAGKSVDHNTTGMIGFITTSNNPDTSSNYRKHFELVYDLLKEATEGTGAKRLGIFETDDMACLNYADMPAAVINMGFLSNPDDDMNLTSADYQKKMAKSLVDGVDFYFQEVEEGE